MKGFYITTSGERKEFSPLSWGVVLLSNSNIKEIHIPIDAKHTGCQYNNITSLTLPNTLESISCDLMNGIEEQNRKKLYMAIFQKR